MLQSVIDVNKIKTSAAVGRVDAVVDFYSSSDEPDGLGIAARPESIGPSWSDLVLPSRDGGIGAGSIQI